MATPMEAQTQGRKAKTMTTTAKEQCNIVADVLARHGVKRFVLSPGSRNAPMIVALARRNDVERFTVVDERSAAFMALGIAQQTGEPVGIVCTSGTALLNYAPAVAEAYYQKLPLIVISADRQREWIDQDDSQTIRQHGALAQFVKKSYDIPARCNDDTARWYANRIVNDAVIEAMRGQRGPVHINVQIDEPLNTMTDGFPPQRQIEAIETATELPEAAIDRLAAEAQGKRILVVAGFGSPNPRLAEALGKLAAYPNIAVLTETIANLPAKGTIPAIDRTLLAMDRDRTADYMPDLLITIGGALVSRILKTLLRKYRPAAHWHVGVTNTTIDCMQSLTKRILTDPDTFFTQMGERLRYDDSTYANLWRALAEKGEQRMAAYLKGIEWCDMKAFSVIIPSIPKSFHVQLSNGTTIRYAQLFGDSLTMPNNCNRGVSGIDGSTSTAVGASLAYTEHPTLLITGDMSFSYDISGLASQYNTPRLKIIVMKNGGGGIFRFIKATSSLPEMERYLEVSRDIPVDRYAAAFGFKYFEALNEAQLHDVLPAFFAEADAPAILAVATNAQESADTLKRYFSLNKNQ